MSRRRFRPLPACAAPSALRRRGLLLGLAGMAALGFAAGPTRAQDETRMVEGQPFALRLQLAGRELVLNGTGVRAVAWFKGYAAGLYLPSRTRSAEQAVAMTGPKRLQLRLLREVPAAEFVKAFDKGVRRNTADAEVVRLADRMAQFAALVQALGTVREGDVVDLDLDPSRGLIFSLNGTLRGEPIRGDDFYAALLRSFIGARPYDRQLKAGLLGA